VNIFSVCTFLSVPSDFSSLGYGGGRFLSPLCFRLFPPFDPRNVTYYRSDEPFCLRAGFSLPFSASVFPPFPQHEGPIFQAPFQLDLSPFLRESPQVPLPPRLTMKTLIPFLVQVFFFFPCVEHRVVSVATSTDKRPWNPYPVVVCLLIFPPPKLHVRVFQEPGSPDLSCFRFLPIWFTSLPFLHIPIAPIAACGQFFLTVQIRNPPLADKFTSALSFPRQRS